jgi:hypothetical protein
MGIVNHAYADRPAILHMSGYRNEGMFGIEFVNLTIFHIYYHQIVMYFQCRYMMFTHAVATILSPNPQEYGILLGKNRG